MAQLPKRSDLKAGQRKLDQRRKDKIKGKERTRPTSTRSDASLHDGTVIGTRR